MSQQAMAASPQAPARVRFATVVTLLALSAVAWVLVAAWGTGMEDDERMLTMGMAFPLFIGMWSLMMAAMMLPAASPMMDAFVRVQSSRRAAGNGTVPVAAFVAGYLLIWCSVGVLAFFIARWLEDAAMERGWLMDAGARIGGGLILAAGVYQLSPLKRRCLGKCRTPMSFIVTSWRDGAVGAVRMGIEHGAYCLGCCWLLFVIIFPLGLMNIAVMVAVTALIFVEKVLPERFRAATFAGVVLIGYGLVVLAVPDALPAM